MKRYRVLHGVGTDVYLVMRDKWHGFFYDDDSLEVVPPPIIPGSTKGRLGRVKWLQIRDEDVPTGLAAVLRQRGITLAGGAK